MKNEEKVKKAKSNEKAKAAETKKNSKFSGFSGILLVVVLVALCIVSYCVIQTIRYKEYTDKMYYYGYNEFYSNGKATAYKKLSNVDMFRVLIGSLNNTTKLDRLALVNKTEEMTEDDVWYQTASKMNLALRVLDEDKNKSATKINAVITAMRILDNSVGVDVEKATLNMSEKKLAKFAATDADYIAMAVTLGLIENNDSALSNKKIIKGELNKLVIELANKYATVYYKDKYLDENANIVKNDVHIVTDKAILPSNDKEFPYIVSNVAKNEYEMPLMVENEKDFISPKELFKDFGKLYGQIDETVANYLEKIVNVNYETITETKFYNDVNRYSIYDYNRDTVDMYVDYVLENKIALKGKVEMLLPVLYYSGERYNVRAKLTIEVLNATTNKDLLFGDYGNNVEYNGKEITMYVDIPLSMSLNSKTLYVEPHCVARRLVAKTDSVKVEKVQGGVIYEENK